MKTKDFSKIVNGTVLGDPEAEITGVSGIKEARDGDITFISSSKFIKDLQSSKASCVIVKEPVDGITITQIKVSNTYYAFAKAIECFYPKAYFSPEISNKAFIAKDVVLGKNVSVLPFAYLADGVSIDDDTVIMPGVYIGGKSKVGNQCLIYPNVVIREGVRIGDRVTIHSGTVIGSDGFGYVFENGVHYKIPQVGGVIVEDDVEIGSNVSIDRATLGNTIIGKGTKIDNLVQIAHNVKIGENSLIISQAGIAGSTELGNFVIIGGQAAAADHTTVESGTIIGGQSGIFGHVTKGVYFGSPAIPHKNWLKSQTLFAKLPELNKRIKKLEERLNKLDKEDLDNEHK